MSLNVTVVGAGIGGLTTAVALRKAGHKVLVLEKHQSKREVGYALSMPPNSTRVLRRLGLDFEAAKMTEWKGLDLVRADMSPIQWIQGPDVDYEKEYGAPFMCAHRVDLHEALWEMAVRPGPGSPVAIREGAEVVSYSPSEGGVTLATGESITADLIVAADGIRSKAHEWIIGEARPATISKTSTLRFVVPTDILLCDAGMSEMIGHADKRSSVLIDGSKRLGAFRSACRNNTLQNFVIFQKRFEKDDLNDDEDHLILQADPEAALQLLHHFNEAVHNIVRCADRNDVYLWKVADRDPLPKLAHERLIVIGDACHPMLSDLGQGASQAIEDAGVLSTVLSGRTDPSEVVERLQLWESLRKPRVGAAQLLSRAEDLAYSLSKDTVQKLRGVLPEKQIPELTRPAVFHFFMEHDSMLEASKAVESRFGDMLNGSH